MVLEHFTVCYKQSITLQNFVFAKFKFIEQFQTTTAPVIPTKPQARGGISRLEKLRIFREIPRLPLVARDDMRVR